MAHIRKTIRENVGTTVTGLSTTGSSVYQSRVFPINASKLPALLVFTKDEEIVETSLKSPRTQHRQLQVIIEAHIKGTADIDDTIECYSMWKKWLNNFEYDNRRSSKVPGG